MRTFLILAGLTLSLAVAAQEIYRWVDRNGVVHYEDQPGSPDAKLIEVIEPNAYESEPATPTYSAGEETDQGTSSGSGYESLSIVSPAPDQVFFGADATVTAAANLDGTLQPDHSLVFFVNGNRRPADGLSLELSNLPRGTYFLRAAVLDEGGNAVVTSQQTTFHVRQPSINSPQSPQAPRQRPRTSARPATTQPPAPRPANPPRQ